MNTKKIDQKSILLISCSVVLIDQLSKLWVIHKLNVGYSLEIIPRIINLKHVRNTGAAFSILSNSTFLLGLLSMLVSLGLITWIYNNNSTELWRGISVSLLLAGTLGNGIDRWRFGYVTDFIELKLIEFPIFNIADIAINMAVILFILEALNKRNNNKSHV